MNLDTFAPFGEMLKAFRQCKNITQKQLAIKLGVHRNTIGGWERGDFLPDSKSIVLECARLLDLKQSEMRQLLDASLTSPFPHWSVPYRRNPFFTGRKAFLDTLHRLLCAKRAAALTQSYALHGLGGIGKTQLALEYACQYALEYSAVFWVEAETVESIVASMVRIANHLKLPEREETDQQQITVAVQHWLITHDAWLLIWDNVEDLELLQRFLPPSRQGAVLLTTRRQALGALAEPLELPSMDGEEGVTLLLRRAGQNNVSSSSAAAELVALLEGLPLALDQAGAYIEDTGCSVEEYLQRCHDQRKYILAQRGSHGGTHPASVATTLRLSVEQVEHEHSAAADLLRVCSFLHPDAIPEKLLLAGASHLGSDLGSVVADPCDFDLVMATLRNASLLTRYPETRTLSMHRLVQAVLQDQMEPGEARLWCKRVIRLVNAAFPEPGYDNLMWCEQCLAHASACVSLIEQVEGGLPEVSELLAKAGNYLMWRGRLSEAEPLLKQAVELGERQYGPDHPLLLFCLTKQAELFWSQGKYDHTELLLQRILALAERYQGADHPKTAGIFNALGILYWKQGKYELAESLYQRALCIREQQLGSEHLETAETFNDLALLYWEQKKYAEAEPLYQRSLHIREQQLGREHPVTAISINNLANLYCYLGKHEQAEPLYQRSLRIREQRFGPEHPKTAIVLINLAALYRDQGKYEQAEPLYVRARAINEQKLGAEHPEMATVLHHLARLYRLQGRMEQAEPLYRRALTISEQQLGFAHPKTAKIRDDYNGWLEHGKSIAGAPNEEHQRHL